VDELFEKTVDDWPASTPITSPHSELPKTLSPEGLRMEPAPKPIRPRVSIMNPTSAVLDKHQAALVQRSVYKQMPS
jgi:hypothetical protein